jgi:Cu(I)/Ag(I) efflux system membrane fusion protein
MSMEFKVKDKALLAGLKPGQAVDFDLAQANPGEFVIERMVPAGAPPAGAAHKGH